MRSNFRREFIFAPRSLMERTQTRAEAEVAATPEGSIELDASPSARRCLRFCRHGGGRS